MVVDDVNGNYRADDGEALGWGKGPLQTITDSAGWLELMAAAPVRLDAPPPVASTYLSGVRVDSSGYFRAAISGLDVMREGPDGLTDADILEALALTGPTGTVELELDGDSVWAVLPGFVDADGGPWLLPSPFGHRHVGVSRSIAQRAARPCGRGGTVCRP